MDTATEVRKPTINYAFAVAAVALLLALYMDTLIYLVLRWYNTPVYSHGFLVIPISLGLAWTIRADLVKADRGIDKGGLWILGLGVFLLVVGYFVDVNPVRSASLIFSTWGAVRYFYGREVTKLLAFPIFFLCFMVVLPTAVIDKVGFPLQLYGSKSAAHAVNAMGIPVFSEGVNMTLSMKDGSDASFAVAQACSGMNSMVELVAMSALLAYLMPLMTFPRRVAMLVFAAPIALLANLTRLIGILLIARGISLNFAMKVFHEWSSPVLFMIALGLMYLLAKGLIWLPIGKPKNKPKTA